MKPITIKEIAELAGVSKSTVSRVLSNPSIVKKSTREAVLQVVQEYDFVPNHLAQGLTKGSTKTIGIVVDELYNNFFIEIVEGVDKILSEFDYSLQLYSSRWVEKKEIRDVSNLLSKRVDGILLAPIDSNGRSIKMLKKFGIPFVLINCIPQDTTIPYVAFDNYKGGYLVAEHINTLEKEQTILITGFPHQTVDERLRGFFDKIDNPDDIIHYKHIKKFEDGKEICNVLISRNRIEQTKTVLFVTNDNVAIGICAELIQRGVKIPEQVEVIGFDNIKISALTKVPLTTVSQSIIDIGKLAAWDLLDLISGKELASIGHIIDPELIIRESSH